ncbi:polysaccharide deacetylase family protein [Paenibacillus sp. J2TS4]|uniref:polysaccharide deacetylase family protein n=1 Tax=Paenibacillus sp. J2TS4 TaxID=2807194 RepID=UPI001B05546F|nr:polysaccharide deacetylase family protein [Paenibacillus sp. J2TS4]GIP33175.1 hydrolase [Paenibacillus sp. J2TS4]
MTRSLIINCDDFGQSKAANQAIIHLLEEGKVSSATLMPPAPEFEEAAAWCRTRQEVNVGLHLTLTSEYDGLRWRSLTDHPSLHDENGYMYKTIRDFELNAAPKAVRAEIVAQFRAVARAGLNITHVDNHMGSLYGLATGRSYLPFVFWECSKRKRPFRIFRKIYKKDTFLASIPNAESMLEGIVELADALGVGMPDYLLSHPYDVEEGETYDSFKKSLIEKVYELPEGVSETYIHPAVENDELKAFLPAWQKRVWEYELIQDEDFAYALKDARVTLTNYRSIRPRSGRARARAALALAGRLLRK